LSGPRRWRYGGLRDFIIGIRFVDGQGRHVRGGGNVVKNAAGFDLPKLFVGSLGRLGILTEATFKVFPSPPAYDTLRVAVSSLAAAQTLLARIATSALEFEAVDMVVQEGDFALYLRLGGLADALPERMARLRAFVGDGDALDDEAAFWRERNGFGWAPPEAALAKAPLSPHKLPALEQALAASGAARTYSVGGHLAWIAWPHAPDALDELLRAQGLSALLLRGDAPSPLLGTRIGATTLERVKGVLDPKRRFLDF
jgi:glycolate oxidase FAD binding subunit